jgi:hypothetical protein
VERQSVQAELDQARVVLRTLVTQASPADLRRPSTGTRWTYEQLLFHMVLGYLIVTPLLPLVQLFGRRPDRYSRTFAGLLNAGRRPFHIVNYLGSCGSALVFHGPRLIRKMGRTAAALRRKLDREMDETLTRRMHFPVDWALSSRGRSTPTTNVATSSR